MSRKGILVILDGYGEGVDSEFNAVANAKSPTLKMLKKQPYSLLKTDSEAVGLFANTMGGSEVGHMTIGAGRIVPTMAKKITEDLESKEIINNKKFVKMIKCLKDNNSSIHFIGLLSDKNIHSNFNHLMSLIDLTKDSAKNIYIHIITDGRDSGVHDSLKYLKILKAHISKLKNVEITSVSGRAYAMDRDNMLERTNDAFNAMFSADNAIAKTKVEEYIKQQHLLGNSDEYIKPVHVGLKTCFSDINKDVICFFNFREDRLRQIVKKCEDLKANIFTMTKVSNTLSTTIFENKLVKNTLSEHLSRLGKTQVKISESTKYAHVTYFLNGGREEPFEKEDRIHIPTKKVENFVSIPKMRAKEITLATQKAMKKNYDTIIVNYSNADMIGHTGNYKAAVMAIEYVDKCLKRLLAAAKKQGYFVMITADHGNSESMVTKNGEPDTAHTLNRVICTIVDDKIWQMKKFGELKDVAPTFLDLMNVDKNKYFKGESLIQK